MASRLPGRATDCAAPSSAVKVSKKFVIPWRATGSASGYQSATMSALVPAAKTESALKQCASWS